MYIIQLPERKIAVPVRPPLEFFILKRRRSEMGVEGGAEKKSTDKKVSAGTEDSFGTSVNIKHK